MSRQVMSTLQSALELVPTAMIRLILVLLAVPLLIDVIVRVVLAVAARRQGASSDDSTCPRRWVVVVPSRAEGEAVEATLESVVAVGGDRRADLIVVLDGADPTAQRAADKTSATVLVKEPPGPTKGAVLRWLVEHHEQLLLDHDAVLLVDVGSELRPGFFDALSWPAGASAVQARLAGAGTGVAGAASFSESSAQSWEDAGRQALGWTVHLRGTGSAIDPVTFCRVVPRLRSRAEDTELTLLLAADGHLVTLGGAGAVVDDQKPCEVEEAAQQRARWLLGEFEIMLRHPRALLRLMCRRPLEGVAVACELISRPLSLTSPSRALLGAGFVIHAVVSGSLLSAAAAAVFGASLAADFWLLRVARGVDSRSLMVSGAQLVCAWLRALVLLPRSLGGWAKTRVVQGSQRSGNHKP